MKHATVFVDILLLFGVVYLLSMCYSNSNKNPINDSKYDITYRTDTIYGRVLLTIITESKATDNFSSSTIEIDNFDKPIDND